MSDKLADWLFHHAVTLGHRCDGVKGPDGENMCWIDTVTNEKCDVPKADAALTVPPAEPAMTDRAELIARLRNARKLVSDLAANGANQWTMSVPPRDDDTDIVLAGALDKAIAELEAAEPAKAVDVLCRECGQPSMNVTTMCYACAHKPAEPKPTTMQEADDIVRERVGTKMADLLEPSSPAVAEDVEQFIRDNGFSAQIAEVWSEWVVSANDVRAFIAARDKQVRADERAKVLAVEPEIPAEIKGRVQAEWFWKGVLAMKESARAAQEQK